MMRKQRRQFVLPALLAALLFAGPAHAHGLAGGSVLDELVAGFSAPLDVPATILLMLASGLVAALWSSSGFPRLGQGLLAGVAAGPALALLLARSGVAIPVWPPLALAILLAVMAALARRWPQWLVQALMLGGGILAVFATLLDHSVADLNWFTATGLAGGVLFFTAAAAALFSLPQMFLPLNVARLGLRIVASWIGAIAILLLAFTLRGTVA